jgi:hypothetical protein
MLDTRAHVARHYANKDFSFDFADTVMNHLFAYVCRQETFPAVLWSIYLAFDRGEYYHPDEDHELHPSERYTRPMIAEILNASQGHHVYQ